MPLTRQRVVAQEGIIVSAPMPLPPTFCLLIASRANTHATSTVARSARRTIAPPANASRAAPVTVQACSCPLCPAASACNSFPWTSALAQHLLAACICPAGGIVIFMSLILLMQRISARTGLRAQWPRAIITTCTAIIIGGVLAAGVATSGQSFSNLTTFSNVLITGFSMLLLLRLAVLVFYGPFKGLLKRNVSQLYYLADVVLTYTLNALRYVLSLFDILSGLQAQLLFNSAYARQVRRSTRVIHGMWGFRRHQALGWVL